MGVERKVWLQVIGSAILVSVACLDPGNLLGDIQAAQDMHYKTIWVVLISHILLYFVQEMAFIVSVRSGTDLANLIRLNYSRRISIFIWASQEIAIISADIQEVVGAVIALKLLFGIQEKFGIPLVLLIVIGILFLQELGQKVFEFGFLILIGMMGICFFINFVLSEPPFGEIGKGFIIDFPRSWTFTAVIGAIIMPQNIFLHSSLVQTRKHLSLTAEQFVSIFRIETAIILVVSFLINFSLVCVFANSKFDDKEITLENAGQYLTEFLKDYSGVLWGLGLFASGVSSTATGALTGQYLMDGIFNLNINRRVRVLVTRMIVIIPCYIIVGSFNVDTIVNLLNLVQIVSLPFVVIPLIKFSQNSPIMDHYSYSKCKFWTVVVLSIFLMTINYISMFDIIRNFGGVGFAFGIAGVIVYTVFCFFLVRLQIKGYNENETKEQDKLIVQLINKSSYK